MSNIPVPVFNPVYEELLKTNVGDRWRHFDNAAYPKNYIKVGSAGLFKLGNYIAVLTDYCTFIHLPENHPWLKLTSDEVSDMAGYPTNTIGCAMHKAHFSPAHWTKMSKEWLLQKFTAPEALEFFGSDLLLQHLGKNTPKRWICLTYDNLVRPGQGRSQTVKLSEEFRFRDARNAINAALDAVKTPSEVVGFPLVATQPISRATSKPMFILDVCREPESVTPAKAEDSEWMTTRNRRRR